MACGYEVPFGATCPCRHSSWNSTGMPSRVFSFIHFCTALVNSTMARGSRCSPGREISPRPFLIRAAARSGRKCLSRPQTGLADRRKNVCSPRRLRVGQLFHPGSCARAGRPRAARREISGRDKARRFGDNPGGKETRRRAQRACGKAQNRGESFRVASGRKVNACNPKSAWYYTITVNVHGKRFARNLFIPPYRRDVFTPHCAVMKNRLEAGARNSLETLAKVTMWIA